MIIPSNSDPGEPRDNVIKPEINQSQNLNEEICRSTIRLRSFKDGELIIQCNQIIRIEAAKAYSYFYLTGGKVVLSSRNLNYHIKVLDTRYFLRPHRSHIVNVLHVAKLLSTIPRKLQMDDGSVIEYSRKKADEVESKLSNLIPGKN